MIRNNLTTRLAFAKKMWVSELLLFSGAGLFHLWSLMRNPSPFVDEAWLAARAWNFIISSKAFSTLDAGVFDRFPGHETYFPGYPF